MASSKPQYGERAKGPPTGVEPPMDTVVDYDLFRTPATEQLKATRDYARSANGDPLDTVLGCVQSLRRYGFCVLDDVIPPDQVDAVCEEVRDAPAKNRANKEAGDAGLRRSGRLKWPSEPVSDLVWMPQYAEHLGHPMVVAVAKAMLDDHIRIAQFNFRAIGVTAEEQLANPNRKLMREWHTDWPHDLIGYGAGETNFEGKEDAWGQRNAGCVRQPFPDVCMALTMIWYLTDGNERTGATWIVPGSHRDHRNPRGPHDGMTVSAPIPGEMQVVAPKGSVFMQDTRSWHCSAMYVPEGERMAMVNRWAPWWLSVQDFGGGHVGYMSVEEFENLPAEVQPLVRHLCPDLEDSAQSPMLDRAQAAADRTSWGFGQQQEDPENVFVANQHVHVPIAPPLDVSPPPKYWGPKLQAAPLDEAWAAPRGRAGAGSKL